MKNSMKRLIECLFVIIPFVIVSTIIAAPVPPELPRIYVDTTYTEPTGQMINVPSGGSLQAAIDSANPGDIIELQPGTSYSGSFTLRAKSNPQKKWIIIRTKGFSIPEEQRIKPSDATQMAKIIATGSAAIIDDDGASHYRIIGIEILAKGVTKRIVDIGNKNTSDVKKQSDHIILDRMYIHAQDSAWVKTAVRVNGSHIAIIDSHIGNITFRRLNGSNFEAQAISGDNGPGPLKVVNNFLEAAGINFIYGGGPTFISGDPADFEIRRNHFYKNPKWKAASELDWKNSNYITVKALLELKTATRALIDGNIFENSWAASDQKGFAIGLKQKTNRTYPEGPFHDVVKDITITNNIIVHANIGVSISPRSVDTVRVKVENNLGIDLHHMYGKITNDLRGWAFGLSHTEWANEQNILINHNTMLNTSKWGEGVRAYHSKENCGKQHVNVTITNNFYNGTFKKDKGCQPQFSNLVLENNKAWSSAMFINHTNDLSGNFRLKNPAQFPGTDGKPVGANINTIMAAIGGELSIPIAGEDGFPSGSIGGSTGGPAAPTGLVLHLMSGPVVGSDAGSNVTSDSSITDNPNLVPVSILFDTDIGPSVDDAGAMAVLHALADNGEVHILGVANSTRQAFGAPALDAINTYYGRPNIPVGTLKGAVGVMESSRYNQYIAQNFPNDLKNGSNAENATVMYRRILAAQPDNSVVFVVVGIKTNLANLLKSSPDQHSSLNGIDLVNKKVKLYVDMGGKFPSGSSFNFVKDPLATQYVFENWPTPIVSSGNEIGVNVRTGSCLANTSRNNPVRKSYELYFGRVGVSRSSWDITAVLYAARGTQNYWTTSAEGSIVIGSDGGNTWSSRINKNHSYLEKRMSDSQMENAINELLCQAPILS